MHVPATLRESRTEATPPWDRREKAKVTLTWKAKNKPQFDKRNHNACRPKQREMLMKHQDTQASEVGVSIAWLAVESVSSNAVRVTILKER